MELKLKKGIKAENDKQVGLNIEIIRKTLANWFLLYSGKGTGKSWAVREHALDKHIKYGDELLIVKRLDVDSKPTHIRKYFENVDVSKLTGGVYNSIEVRGNEIFFATVDEHFKSHKGKRIGHVIPLSAFERYKGTDYPYVSTIIFEEFISESGGYLPNESSTLMKLINTVFRPQTKAEFELMNDAQKERYTRREVWLLGNTISRNCVYFNDWYLKNTVTQQPNTIDIYIYNYPDIDDLTGKPRQVKLACWYIGESYNNNKKSHGFVFGKAYDTIVKGAWECDIYPKLEYPYNDYNRVFEFLVKSDSLNYVVQLLEYNDLYTLYVYPTTRPRHFERIITKNYSMSINITDRLLKSRKIELFIGQLLQLNKICYSDNLTGTEFDALRQRILTGL